MSKQTPIKRWIAALLAIAMVIGIMPTNVVHAADTFESLSFLGSDIVPNPKLPVSVATEEGQDINTPEYADSDVIRVSIVLEKKSTIDAGYPIANIADNSAASYADGKVKAELCDDPDRNGVYDYSFTVNDLFGQESNYTLSTDIFTQDLTTDGVNLYLDNWTTPLSANVTYTVDGVTFLLPVTASTTAASAKSAANPILTTLHLTDITSCC